MLALLQNLLIPRQSNNYKAKTLHLSSLSSFILIIIAFQIIMTTVSLRFPGILGYASNINADDLINITNEKRTSQNLQPLKSNSVLAEAARQKASDMFTLDYWAHFSPSGKSPWWFFQNTEYSYRYAGENLARDFDQSNNVVIAWMNSPTHRDNILNSNYEEIGIAVVDGVLQGQETTLVVQFFGTPVSAVAEAPPAEKIPQAPAESAGLIPSTEVLEVKIEPIAVADLPETTNQSTILSQSNQQIRQPILSSFNLTKTVSLATTGLLILVLLADALLVYQHKTIRISGKTLAHVIFLGALLSITLLSQPGVIL
ncbi:hypothetical protein KKD62_00265 [Patescibacteria group bacterium]|nr:hypothetical protein [Patescibacteria group bacterium]MBU1931771.1 hypothetical protein [Patescibacteria group bacterium]